MRWTHTWLKLIINRSFHHGRQGRSFFLLSIVTSLTTDEFMSRKRELLVLQRNIRNQYVERCIVIGTSSVLSGLSLL